MQFSHLLTSVLSPYRLKVSPCELEKSGSTSPTLLHVPKWGKRCVGCRLPLLPLRRGNEPYGLDINSSSKTDVHKQTKWQRTGWAEEKGKDGAQKQNVFLFCCSTNGSDFHLLSSMRAHIGRDVTGLLNTRRVSVLPVSRASNSFSFMCI